MDDPLRNPRHWKKIYDVDDCMETLKAAAKEICPLHFHYRIGRNICRLADGLAKDSDDYEPLEATSNYDEARWPSSVEHIDCSDIDEQAEEIIKKLTLQLKTYPNELLGVISPRKEEVFNIWEHIANTFLAPVAMVQGGRSFV